MKTRHSSLPFLLKKETTIEDNILQSLTHHKSFVSMPILVFGFIPQFIYNDLSMIFIFYSQIHDNCE